MCINVTIHLSMSCCVSWIYLSTLCLLFFPSLNPPVVSCFPASPHRLDSQSAEGHSHQRITHPSPGWRESSVCLHPSEQQETCTVLAVPVWVCVFVCVSASVVLQALRPLCVCAYNDLWLCQGGKKLESEGTLCLSLQHQRLSVWVYVNVCVCVWGGGADVDQAMSASQKERPFVAELS